MQFSTVGLLLFHKMGYEEDQMRDLYAPRYTIHMRLGLHHIGHCCAASSIRS